MGLSLAAIPVISGLIDSISNINLDLEIDLELGQAATTPDQDPFIQEAFIEQTNKSNQIIIFVAIGAGLLILFLFLMLILLIR